MGFFSRDSLEEAQDEIRALKKSNRKLEESSTGLRRDIRDLTRQVDSLRAAIALVDQNLDHHEHELGDVDGLQATVSEVEQLTYHNSTITERLDDLEARVESVAARLEDTPRPPWAMPPVSE